MTEPQQSQKKVDVSITRGTDGALKEIVVNDYENQKSHILTPMGDDVQVKTIKADSTIERTRRVPAVAMNIELEIDAILNERDANYSRRDLSKGQAFQPVQSKERFYGILEEMKISAPDPAPVRTRPSPEPRESQRASEAELLRQLGENEKKLQEMNKPRPESVASQESSTADRKKINISNGDMKLVTNLVKELYRDDGTFTGLDQEALQYELDRIGVAKLTDKEMYRVAQLVGKEGMPETTALQAFLEARGDKSPKKTGPGVSDKLVDEVVEAYKQAKANNLPPAVSLQGLLTDKFNKESGYRQVMDLAGKIETSLENDGIIDKAEHGAIKSALNAMKP